MIENDYLEAARAGGHSAPDNSAFDAERVFEEARRSVVNIAGRLSFAGADIDQTLGSGFVVEALTDSCRIATDNHVVSGKGGKLVVRFSEKESYPAELELSDPKNDLSILRISGVQDADKVCKALPLHDSETPVKSFQELAKLSARMLETQFTVGKVDEYFKRFQAAGLPLLPGEDPQRDMIFVLGPAGQGGDSGGPIVDKDGKVVGINSSTADNGYAMTPAHYLKKSLDQLNKSK